MARLKHAEEPLVDTVTTSSRKTRAVERTKLASCPVNAAPTDVALTNGALQVASTAMDASALRPFEPVTRAWS